MSGANSNFESSPNPMGAGGTGIKKLSQPFKPFDVKKKLGGASKPSFNIGAS